MFTHSRSHALLRDLMAVGDTAILLFAALIASWLRFDAIIPPDHLVLPALAAPTFYLGAMFIFAGYNNLDPKSLQMGLLRVILALSVSFSLLLAFAYFSKVSDDFSRLWTGYFALVGLLCLVLLRLFVFGILHLLGRQDAFRPTVAIICSAPRPTIIKLLEARAEAHRYRIVHQCILDREQVTGNSLQDWLVELRRASPDKIVVALSKEDKEVFAGELDDIDAISAEILEAESTMSERTEDPTTDQALAPDKEWIVMSNLPFVRRAVRPFGMRGWWVKRIEDIILGLIAIVIAAPVMLFVGIIVKLSSPGPMFYVQLRHGFNGEEIRVLKFRSMYVDQCTTGNSSTVRQATRGDARITPVGAIIRKTSLDELPQLFNVIRGDMSLVGPRPHATQHNALYRSRIDGYFSRHRVKPGITGWAQVNGWRGETSTDEKMRQRILHDLFYIRHWSLWLDIRILFLTVISMFVDEEAY